MVDNSQSNTSSTASFTHLLTFTLILDLVLIQLLRSLIDSLNNHQLANGIIPTSYNRFNIQTHIASSKSKLLIFYHSSHYLDQFYNFFFTLFRAHRDELSSFFFTHSIIDFNKGCVL